VSNPVNPPHPKSLSQGRGTELPPLSRERGIRGGEALTRGNRTIPTTHLTLNPSPEGEGLKKLRNNCFPPLLPWEMGLGDEVNKPGKEPAPLKRGAMA